MKKLLLVLLPVVALSGCQSTGDSEQQGETAPKVLNRSFLKSEDKSGMEADAAPNEAATNLTTPSFVSLESLIRSKADASKRMAANAFNDENALITMAANNMPISSFIHYVFGEILGANYVIGSKVKDDNTTLTLNIGNPTSKLDAFRLVVDLLSRNQITIDFDNSTYFLQKAELSKAKATIGIGRELRDIPVSAGQILQVVPLKYGIKGAIERTVKQLVDAQITIDFDQSALFVLGDKANIQRTLELVQILDVPANRGRHIGLMHLTYISIDDFLLQGAEVLEAEGIMVGSIRDRTKNVALVALPHIGAITIFASDEEILDRVRYWGSVLDRPSKGESVQYFVYEPEFARASDLGESIGDLLTLGQSRRRNKKSTGDNADSISQQDGQSNNNTFNNENISFVIDERSNSLIFSAKGSHYQNLLPLLRKLDVLPKQILLEVMIAEVTLTDEFKYGVEFALRNSSRFTASTLGALGASDAGGLNLSFLDSDLEATASFFKQNQFVNVISNPTMLVRDGVSASISVGTEIPVQGGTVVDDGVQTTNVEYRKTGVDINVTPTVNAQGVVIMTIDQVISNTVDANTNSTTPSIFNRALSTEAVVNSGQTVILGGLISEDVTMGETKVPGLADLPLIGSLFKGRDNIKTKTELVMLVTPKVIDNNNEWEKLLEDFELGLENVQFEN